MSSPSAVGVLNARGFLPLDVLPGAETEEQLLRILTAQARRAAANTQPAGQDVEDLLAEGFLCARRALDSFDPNQGVPFAAYFAIVLRRHFIDLGRRKRLQTNTDLEPVLARRADQDDRTGEFQREVRDALERFLRDRHLSEKKREAFRLFHLEGWKLKQLARHFGKCSVTMRRWLQQAESRFKRLWLQGEMAD